MPAFILRVPREVEEDFYFVSGANMPSTNKISKLWGDFALIVNTIILLAFVAVIAFGFGVWSWIYISSKSPKIYELKPVIEQIFSDLFSLFRNLKKLFDLVDASF